MRIRLASLAILLLATLGIGQENYAANWSGHRTQFVNTSSLSPTGTPISANVVKYPMLVRLGQADSGVFSAAKTDGADLRFTKSNNTTRLKHSIETWDAVNRIGAVWVLLDTVYAENMTQNFRMHWGNAGAADSSQTNAVFDSANGFEAVWHMGNASGATPRGNSVAGGNPATPGGTGTAAMLPVPGLIGMGDTLRSSLNNSGNDDHFSLGSGYQFAQGAGTLSMWVKYIPAGNWHNFIALSAGASVGAGNNQGGRTNNIWFGRDGSSSNFIHRTSMDADTGDGVQGIEGTARTASGALNPTNTWAHFTVTFKDTLGRHRTLYKNGTMLGDFPAVAGDTANNILPVTRTLTFLGRSNWGDRNFRGVMDEIRVSKVARSADWVKLDYASQNAAQTLVVDSTAPGIAYTVDTIKAEVGYTISTVLPAYLSGVPRPTVAISPALPAGLTFTTTNNANRGMISGSPTGAAGTTMHVITATNAKGTASDTLYVTVAANSENYTTWPNTRTLSFNSPASATLNRFPLLVRLGPADSAVFAQAGANGANLRFSRTDAIKLKYSVDHWDAAARKAGIWVLMDQVAPGANTLRMHWGNGSATSQSSGPSVFEASNGYVSVWHMGNPIGDSLGGARPNMANPGTNNATPYYATPPVASMIQDGAIGKADSLRGQGASAAGDHFWLDSSAAFSSNFPNGISMSLWIKPMNYPGTSFVQWFTLGNRTTGTCPPCAGGGNGTNSIWLGRVGNANNFVGGEALNGTTSGGRIDGPTGSATPDEWQYYTMTILGTTANGQKMYRNGVLVAQRTSTQALQSVSRTANFLGRATWNDPTSTGLFDEARVSNVIRDSNWIKLEYASQRPGAMPLSNLSYGPISGSPGTPIAPRAPNIAALGYSYTGTLPAGITFNDTTGVISGTPAGTGAATITVTATSGVWSVSALVTLSFGAADGNYATAWSGHQYVSINAGDAPVGVNDTLRRFPLLVRLGAADAAIFTASQKNGADIRFTKLNNVTRLKHEIDHWDSAGRSAAVWVLVDTVYGRTNGSRLRMHYGNSAVADSSQPGAVFDSAHGYVGVWHMGGSSSAQNRANAVPGGNPAVPAGSTTNLATGWDLRAGAIGIADSLRNQSAGTSANNRNSDDYLNLGTGKYANFSSGLTISMWAKPIEQPNYTGWTQYISFSNGQATDNIWVGRQGGTMNLSAEVYGGTTSWGHIHGPEVQVYDVWQHLVYTVTAAGNQMVVRNGVMAAEQAGPGPVPNVERAQNHIGRSPWGDRNYLGGMDEVRIAKVARSIDWLKLEYHNQAPTGTAVVRTTNLVPITVTTVGIHQATVQPGEALSFQRLGQGLLFQVRTEAASRARLSVVDMHGRILWSRSLDAAPGVNTVEWNGTSHTGTTMGSGVYVVRMSLLDEKGKVTHRLDRKVPLTAR